MHGHDGNTYKILARKPDCKSRHRWKDIIKRDLRRLWFEGDWTKDSLLNCGNGNCTLGFIKAGISWTAKWLSASPKLTVFEVFHHTVSRHIALRQLYGKCVQTPFHFTFYCKNDIKQDLPFYSPVHYTVRSKRFRTVFFFKFEDTWGRLIPFFFKFKISSFGIYTGLCAVVQFLKSCRKFLFLGLLEFIGYGFLDLNNICKVESF